MAELGKIQPVKKAACPHCGHILAGAAESYKHQQHLNCPKCKKPIKSPEASAQASPPQTSMLQMNLNAQMLQWQLKNPKPENGKLKHE